MLAMLFDTFETKLFTKKSLLIRLKIIKLNFKFLELKKIFELIYCMFSNGKVGLKSLKNTI